MNVEIPWSDSSASASCEHAHFSCTTLDRIDLVLWGREQTDQWVVKLGRTCKPASELVCGNDGAGMIRPEYWDAISISPILSRPVEKHGRCWGQRAFSLQDSQLERS